MVISWKLTSYLVSSHKEYHNDEDVYHLYIAPGYMIMIKLRKYVLTLGLFKTISHIHRVTTKMHWITPLLSNAHSRRQMQYSLHLAQITRSRCYIDIIIFTYKPFLHTDTYTDVVLRGHFKICISEHHITLKFQNETPLWYIRNVRMMIWFRLPTNHRVVSFSAHDMSGHLSHNRGCGC